MQCVRFKDCTVHALLSSSTSVLANATCHPTQVLLATFEDAGKSLSVFRGVVAITVTSAGLSHEASDRSVATRRRGRSFTLSPSPPLRTILQRLSKTHTARFPSRRRFAATFAMLRLLVLVAIARPIRVTHPGHVRRLREPAGHPGFPVLHAIYVYARFCNRRIVRVRTSLPVGSPDESA